MKQPIAEEDYLSIQQQVRTTLLGMHYAAHAGHIACSLSCIDMLIAVFLIQKKEEDSVILSKGHAASALYACLNYKGEISNEQLTTFYQNGTRLPAHPAPNTFKSIPFATGSLGHGFPLGAGIAKANKLLGNTNTVYVIMSDGETNEGTTWEAGHFSRQHQLDNLIVLVDKNNLQGFGKTQEVLGDTSTPQQWKSLGFEVIELDGHHIPNMVGAMQEFKKSPNQKPKVIIADTIKGKGVTFMENKLDWHYLPMSEDQYAMALKEITTRYSN
jgi:transketolase